MYVVKALKFVAVVVVLCALASAIGFWFWAEHTLLGYTNAATVVAIAVGVVGSLISRGARIGDNPVHTEMASSVADSPGGLHAADHHDMMAGVTYGALLIVAGVAWLLIVVCFHKLASLV